MSPDILKHLVPDRPIPMRVWRGPFRGARIVMNPRSSLRMAFGLYEHENNAWLELALRRVSRVLDVGASEGYFTFGSLAAFRRLGIKGEIVAFEPDTQCARDLRVSIAAQGTTDVRVEIVQAFVGRGVGNGLTTLDTLPANNRDHTLIKIDVEGAELDVIAGARSWMNPSNPFIIEVHKEEYIGQLQRIFAERQLKMVQVNQRPLPLLGREQRADANWWLVSELGA
jgi:Methyltransferase FkbM domain